MPTVFWEHESRSANQAACWVRPLKVLTEKGLSGKSRLGKMGVGGIKNCIGMGGAEQGPRNLRPEKRFLEGLGVHIGLSRKVKN